MSLLNSPYHLPILLATHQHHKYLWYKIDFLTYYCMQLQGDFVVLISSKLFTLKVGNKWKTLISSLWLLSLFKCALCLIVVVFLQGAMVNILTDYSPLSNKPKFWILSYNLASIMKERSWENNMKSFKQLCNSTIHWY